MPSDKSAAIAQKDRENGTPTPPTEERESGERCKGCGGGGVVTLTDHAPKCDGYTCAPDCPIPVSMPCPVCTPAPADAEGEPIVHFDGMPPTADRSPCGASDDADKVAWRLDAVTCQPCIDAIKARSAR